MTRKYSKARPGKQARAGVEIVRKALLERKGSWPVLSKDNKLNYRWMVAFGNGKIKDPGYTRLLQLAEVLNVDIREPEIYVSLNQP